MALPAVGCDRTQKGKLQTTMPNLPPWRRAPLREQVLDDKPTLIASGPSRRQQASEFSGWIGYTLAQFLFYLLLLVAIAMVLSGGR